MKKAIILLLLLNSQLGISQELTQSIRGKITEKGTQLPLTGVNIYLVDDNIGAISDEDGNFYIENIPIGRKNIVFSLIGFNSIPLQNISLFTGKELVLNIEMEESLSILDGVTVTAKTEIKDRQEVNFLKEVGVKDFSFDETNRFAGALGDPSRMVTSFAGVQAGSDARNDIIIRGNSPIGLLWRLNDFNIPNPNHFGYLGTTGGPVSILNNNMLDKSNFMIGAFPSNYGNLNSGAFDLKLRTGNPNKHEFIGQIGFNGLELGAEGPLSKNSSATYLVNFRYSTLEFMDAIGFGSGWGAVPQYKDLTFVVDIPLGRKYGKINIFGIGGSSYIEMLKKNNKDADYNKGANLDTYFGSNMGVMGISHIYYFNENINQKVGVSIDGLSNSTKLDSLNTDGSVAKLKYGNKSHEINMNLFYNLTFKLSKKDLIKTGIYYKRTTVSLLDSVFVLNNNEYLELTDTKGSSSLTEMYVNYQHKLSEDLVTNVGVHYQYLKLNGANSIEPRLGIKYKLGKSTIFGGYALTSQSQPLVVYFYQTKQNDGSFSLTNKNLGFTKSHHFNIGFERLFFNNWNMKVELYNQYIFDVPVETKDSYISLLNQGADFGTAYSDSLVNNGSGKNYGIDITLERYFTDNFYMLTTASFYNSSYKGSDNIERNTAFNGGYSLGVVTGYEMYLRKNMLLNFNIKYTQSGGNRYSEILLEKSRQKGYEVRDYDNAFAFQFSTYLRLDFRVSFKYMGSKVSQEWAIDIQNATNRDNVFRYAYNPVSKEIETEYQQGLFPMFTYRVYF